MTSTKSVLEEIAKERNRQDEKWGEQNHSPADYLTILALEAKFAGKPWDDYRKELVQVAAVAVAMIECFDRNKNNQP